MDKTTQVAYLVFLFDLIIFMCLHVLVCDRVCVHTVCVCECLFLFVHVFFFSHLREESMPCSLFIYLFQEAHLSHVNPMMLLWSIPWCTICCIGQKQKRVVLYRAGLFRPHMPGVLFSLAFVSLNSLFSSSRHIETEALFHTRCLCTHKETRQL